MKLDIGIDNSNDFKKLLRHYRDLAALLEPAKTIKTITTHRLDDFEITQTEISALTDQYFYRNLAKTNKLPPLDENAVNESLDSWRDKKNRGYDVRLQNRKRAYGNRYPNRFFRVDGNGCPRLRSKKN
jgi:hypothetical protein